MPDHHLKIIASSIDQLQNLPVFDVHIQPESGNERHTFHVAHRFDPQAGKLQLTSEPDITIDSGRAHVRQTDFHPFRLESVFTTVFPEADQDVLLIVSQEAVVRERSGTKKADFIYSISVTSKHEVGQLKPGIPVAIAVERNSRDDPDQTQPAFLSSSTAKQQFYVLVSPFGERRINDRAKVTIEAGDHLDQHEILTLSEGNKGEIPKRDILDDGTGVLITASGLKSQRNYLVNVQADGDKNYSALATTKVGPWYDTQRKLATGET